MSHSDSVTLSIESMLKITVLIFQYKANQESSYRNKDKYIYIYYISSHGKRYFSKKVENYERVFYFKYKLQTK